MIKQIYKIVALSFFENQYVNDGMKRGWTRCKEEPANQPAAWKKSKGKHGGGFKEPQR